MKHPVRGLAFGAAAAGALCAGGAQAESFNATYALSIIGLPIGQAHAQASLQPDSYKVDIGLQLGGVASLVTKAKGAATATGQILNSTILPAAYANTTANSTETRTVRMGLQAGTVRAIDISPPFFDMDGRVPVTDAHKTRIVDPVSALIMRVPPGQELTGPSACNRTISVFDGVTRFDVELAYAGDQTAQTRGYAGPVTVCSARYTPIAGHRPDSSSTRYMANNHDISVWLAPLPDAHVVVPLHIAIGTAAGKLVIEASEFEIDQRRADTRR